jgi:CIC family chloride channel protein
MMPGMSALRGTSLSDFSVDPVRLVWMSALAAVAGLAGTGLAWLLLALIGFITHLAYLGDLGHSLIEPDPRHWGPVSIVVPIAGALIVGLIARYGSDKIRGHGIPEAIQSILERDSIIQARVAFFKPIASAIAIGTGNPFGAEGPIIMTGGAIGSLFAQFLHLSALERRTLLVAGAAAGMSATFGAPIASVLIAVELLLFEWRPRSFIPVVVASFVAAAARVPIVGAVPPFVATHAIARDGVTLGWALVVGLCGGVVSMLMTKLVYLTEDAYGQLPLHWMWWPAIGAVVVGVGGWFVPQVLGVGYPTIDALVNGQMVAGAVVGIIVVKIAIWVASLSSGTSGGVLAPLLMIGAAMGTLLAQLLPGHAASAWAIVGMAALMGGTMRAPFMGTLFALETTRAWGLAPDVFVGCIAATAFTVVFVPRSILTEKLSRRGTHVSREYAVHPLELIPVEDVMQPAAGERPLRTIHAADRVRAAADAMAESGARRLAVVDDAGAWIGVVELDDLLRAWQKGRTAEGRRRRVRRMRTVLRRLQRIGG